MKITLTKEDLKYTSMKEVIDTNERKATTDKVGIHDTEVRHLMGSIIELHFGPAPVKGGKGKMK